MSSPEERSPKRQRRSYSPASPPVSTSEETKNFVHPPQTPPPSVHMSPSWQQSQPLPGLGMQGVTFPTPPSTAGFQSQMMGRGPSSDGGQGESGPENESTSRTEGEGRTQGNDTQHEGDVSMAEDESEHRRSDHERNSPPGSNVLYKLSTEPVPPSQPEPSQNLLELYSLQRIQASVARRDPVTGDKINRLRKSYVGKVKELGLEGRNEAKQGQAELEGLVDPAWSMELQDGRTLWQDHKGDFILGEHNQDSLFELLGPALDMRPGHLPSAEHNQWKNMLGLDDSSLTKPTPTSTSPSATTQPTKTAASNLLSKTVPATAVRNSAPASPRNLTARPERAGKKRSYKDASFDGYAEGFEDDGYSTGGMDEPGRRSSASKRQKRKDFSTANSPPFNAPGSSSSSMVGVRSS